MKFYKRYPGDITIKTGDLTLAEFGAYDRLLDHYYAKEQPIDPLMVYAIARCQGASDRRAVDSVVAELFEHVNGGFRPLITPGFEQEQNAWRRCLDVSIGTWARLRSKVFARDGYRCRYCGVVTSSPDCDHVKPLSEGGRSAMENLVTACRRCNRSKGARALTDWSPA